MPKLTNSKLPQYCRLSQKNIGYFWKDGKKIYLPGKYGSPESLEAYNKEMASLLEERVDKQVTVSPKSGGKIKHPLTEITVTKDLTIVELLHRFGEHAKTYYVKNGKPTGSAYQLKVASDPVKEHFADLKASKFTKLELKFVQERMVESGLSRGVVNARIGRIRTIFNWAVEEGLIDEDVAIKLKSVKALKKGRTKAPDHPKRKPVADDVVEKTLLLLSPVVRDMVVIERETGCRPGEIFSMTWNQIDTSDDIWIYMCDDHKTIPYDIIRPIPLRAKCQKILERYRDTPPDAIIFSPKRNAREQAAEKAAKRKTKRQPSQVKRYNNKSTRREHLVGDEYNRKSYLNAIKRGISRYDKTEIKAAKEENREPVLLEKWFPYRLRHSAATETDHTLGREATRRLLGHTSDQMTDRYVHESIEEIKKMAREMERKLKQN